MLILRLTLCLFPLLPLLASPVVAAPPERGTTVDLSADASRPAINDLLRATMFAEATGATPAEAASTTNSLIADALKTARAYGNVRTQSGAIHTYPVHAKGGRIDGWRMRAELLLESSDPAALPELLGKLQSTLGVSALVIVPKAETRQQAENEALIAALGAFKARAQLIADAMSKPYRIRHLAISTSGRTPTGPLMRAAAAADPGPLPVEAGETLVTATASGQIEFAP
ncbi:SIMPL domain-containing protein [Accumulibacter sp.]|uniref:SIMPL domain-containing protein n=1 Tax=Accumulibacter sp. TaxID=2053492 RepID=UPI0025E1FC72|nr:SIMPL domain-containing protein [Accumulibacter sp.]MCM8626203.1 SIMPL domain-containing protein [Accumulibacter sp.]